MTLTIEIMGLERIRDGVRSLGAALPDIVDQTMLQWADETGQSLRATPYPPPPPGSHYQRTGRLAASWGARRLEPGVVAITNHASAKGRVYPTYVIGTAEGGKQAWMHSGRWWVAREKVIGRLPTLLARLESRLQMELANRGLDG